jgi:hypothetical protein
MRHIPTGWIAWTSRHTYDDRRQDKQVRIIRQHKIHYKPTGNNTRKEMGGEDKQTRQAERGNLTPR